MFDASIYRERRSALMRLLPDALILLPGASAMPVDFAANTHPFVQDGSFRYLFGVDRPDLAGLIDAATGRCVIFGEEDGLDDVIWFGPRASLSEEGARAGVSDIGSMAALVDELSDAKRSSRAVLRTPPHSAETALLVERLLGRGRPGPASPALMDAIITLREVKAPEELAEMELAIAVSAEMHHAAMAATRPGRREREIGGPVEGLVRARGMRLAYQSILTARGEVLHNPDMDAVLAAGDLVLHDGGARAPSGYCADVTRTFPASGRFNPLQRQLYEIVLKAQLQAIDGCRPGRRFLDLHLAAAQSMAASLVELGLFRGEPDEIVSSGAYALCFQTGLGHLIGLDVHDMESFGEDRVGYGGGTERSALFGLRSLRLAKPLREGMTVTVEPGLYFIPQLIDAWRAEGRHRSMIDYEAFERMKGFGGIRIEDDVVVGADGGRVLGPSVAKSVAEIEERMQGG